MSPTTETHKQVIVLRTDLNMRKGKMCAQAAHASLKAILDCAWPADQIHATGDSPRIAEKTTYVDAPGWLSGDYRCVPNTTDIRPWVDGLYAKVVVGVGSEAELLAIHEKAKAAKLITSLILDHGFTEFKGVKTYTCVAVGPGKIEEVDKITGDLNLL